MLPSVAEKGSLLAKDKSGSRIDTVIYHMDMRTTGKSFQRYRDRAAAMAGVRFERARVHSITSDLQTGDPVIRAMGLDGRLKEEAVDLVVLAVGQRPSPGTAALAEKAQKTGRIALAFLGDGTLGEGALYESLNLAALWQLPVLYVLENNGIAQTTPVELTVAGSISARF